jgi:DNA 3'-phosphatase
MKQPVTPTPAGGSVAPHNSPVQWLWQSSVTRDEWRPFPPSQGDAVESGWAAAQERVSLDAERYVDLRTMKQCRTDDPTRSRRVRREPPVADDSPARKRQHTEQAKPPLPSSPAATVAPLASSASPAAAAPATAPALAATAATAATATTASTSTPPAAAGGDEDLVPREVAPPSDASWFASRDSLLIRRAHEAPRSCAACFDMDGTLLRWTLDGERWPNKLTDYALWSGRVAAMLQGMHADGYKIVVMSNQSKIQGAVEGSGRTGVKKNGEGKTAARIRTLVDWLAVRCGVPLHGLFATRNNEYRKPAPGMWAAMEQALRRHTYSCSLSCV